MIYADLHIHTNHSDGVCEIDDVLDKLVKSGVKAFAITDHDTTHHWEEIKQKAEALNLETIRGVEMSCYDFDVYKKVHILGLWLEDVNHVNELCSKTLKCRDEYHKELIKKLENKGYYITYEEAKKHSPYNIVFKMHIFQALTDKYPDEMSPDKYKELFASETSKETDMKMGYIDVQEGIEAIKKDGGVAILAHPVVYDNYDEIHKYVEYGLQGIEINHSKMKKEDYVLTEKIAEEDGLLRSGGSDFHDPNLIKFGVNGLTKDEYETLKKRAQEIRLSV